MQNNKLEILVTAKDAASSVIKGVGNSFGQLSDNAVAGSKVVGTAIIAAGVAAAAFGKTSVDAYFSAAEASAKLSTNLLNVKGNTQANVDSLNDLASSLQAVGVIEDDVIKAGMSQLATFNLTGDSIATLTPKITDMVAQLKGHNATAEDMVGINNLIGKVMTGNVGALSRYGVTLSDASAEVIKNGTESEKAAEIVKVLGENYGEVNKALRNTPQGMITGLKNAFGDLQEGVGEMLVTAARPLVQAFNDWIAQIEKAGGFIEYFDKLINENKDTFIKLAGAIGFALIPALASIVAAAAPVIVATGLLMAAGALLAPVVNDLANKFGGWDAVLARVKDIIGTVKEAVEVLFDSFKANGNTIDDQTNKLSLFGEIGERLRGSWEGLKSAGKAVWDAIKMGIDFLMPSLVALWSTFTDNLLPTLIRLWQFVEPALIPTLKILGGVIGGVLVAAIWIAINILNAIIQVVTWFINILIEVVQRVIWFATMVIQYIQFVYNMWKTIFQAIWGVVTWLVNAAIGYFQYWYNNITSIIGGIPGFFRWAFQSAWNVVTGIWNGISGFFGGIVGRIAGALGGVTHAITAPFQRAFDFVRDIPSRMVGAISNVGQLLRDKLGGFDIPGPLGLVRDVIPGFARGVNNFGGGLAVVGERGPELVNLPRGADVIGNHQLSGVGVGKNVHIEIHGGVHNDSAEASNAFMDRLDRLADLAGQGFAI